MLRVNHLTGFNRRRAGGATTYRYLRLVVTNTHGATYAGFYEIEYSPDAGTTWYPTSDMTSNTAPSPLVASVSNALSPFLAWRAYDGSSASTTNLWSTDSGFSAGAYSTIDLGSGNGITPNRCRVTNYNAGGVADYSPTEIKIYGSNTGAFSGEETLISTQSSLPSRAEKTVTTYTL